MTSRPPERSWRIWLFMSGMIRMLTVAKLALGSQELSLRVRV